MLFPIFSYDDGTEVTASKPDNDGKISLYIEKFDKKNDEFINATIIMPDVTVKTSHGYSERELEDMLSEYSEIKEDIMSYVLERTKRSA